MTSWDFPDTDREERPEATVENVPDDVVESAVSIATAWKKCPRCGTEQFVNVVSGFNSSHECRECGGEYTVVG